MNAKGDYPLYLGDILLADAQWRPGLPLPEGFVEVHPTPMPQPMNGKMIVLSRPEHDGTNWNQTWAYQDIQTPFDTLPEPIKQDIQNRFKKAQPPNGQETP